MGLAKWGIEVISFTGTPIGGGLLINHTVIGLDASGTATLPNGLGGVLIETEAERVRRLREKLLAEIGEEHLAGEQAFGGTLTDNEACALGLEETTSLR